MPQPGAGDDLHRLASAAVPVHLDRLPGRGRVGRPPLRARLPRALLRLGAAAARRRRRRRVVQRRVDPQPADQRDPMPPAVAASSTAAKPPSVTRISSRVRAPSGGPGGPAAGPSRSTSCARDAGPCPRASSGPSGPAGPRPGRPRGPAPAPSGRPTSGRSSGSGGPSRSGPGRDSSPWPRSGGRCAARSVSSAARTSGASVGQHGEDQAEQDLPGGQAGPGVAVEDAVVVGEVALAGLPHDPQGGGDGASAASRRAPTARCVGRPGAVGEQWSEGGQGG